MADSQITIGEKLADSEDTFRAKIPTDIIKGWNDRRQSNNIDISSLTPFVQLIGIFNEKEWELMLEGRKINWSKNVIQDMVFEIGLPGDFAVQYLKKVCCS